MKNCENFKNSKPRVQFYWLECKWKEVKGKPDKINELILKTKAYLKEEPDIIK